MLELWERFDIVLTENRFNIGELEVNGYDFKLVCYYKKVVYEFHFSNK